MDCSVCKGSGLSPIPHFPSSSGGWLDEKYHSGIVCGACNGSGRARAGDGEHDDDVPRDRATESAPANLPEAEVWLWSTRISFETVFELRQVFPQYLSGSWVTALKVLDVHQPRDSLAILDKVEASYGAAKQFHRPPPGKSVQGAINEMEFSSDCASIERDLYSLRWLMEHVWRHLRDKTDTA